MLIDALQTWLFFDTWVLFRFFLRWRWHCVHQATCSLGWWESTTGRPSTCLLTAMKPSSRSKWLLGQVRRNDKSKFLCLCGGVSRGQRHYVFGCPSVCLSVPFEWMRYLRNTLREFLQIWPKRLLGLKDELIRFWWSKVTLLSLEIIHWNHTSI